MAIATITQAIVRGEISIYLSGNDNAKGALYGGRIAAPGSPVTIAIVTQALAWGFDGGAQTDQDLREMANYLIWLIGFYGQQAQVIDEGAGGGTVIPPSDGVLTPITISGPDFSTATEWDYPSYAGKSLTVFSNGISRYLTAGSEWEYTSGGINILVPGFDSATLDYTLVITIIR